MKKSLPGRWATTALDVLGRTSIVWICLLCLIVRLLYLWLSSPEPGASAYWKAAETLWGDGRNPPSTFLEPLYVLFLAASRQLGGDSLGFVLTLQVALSTAGCYALYGLIAALSGRREAAALGCFLYAIHPYLIRQSTALIYLPLLTPLLIVALRHYLDASKPRSAALFGLTAGLALLTRADFAVAYGLLAGRLLWKRRYKSLLTALAATLLVVGPAVARQVGIDGSVLPTRGGFDLLKGNCEYSDRLLPDYSLDLLNDFIHRTLMREAPRLAEAGSRERDAFYRAKAIGFIRENPWRTLRLKVLNVFYLYSPWLVPSHPVGRETRLEIDGDRWRVVGAPRRSPWPLAAHVVFSVLVLAAAAVGVLSRRGLGDDVPLLQVAAGYTAVYSVFWPATRLRASFEFVLLVYAGYGLWRLLRATSE